MTRQGKVLRVPSARPGLVIVGGQQHPFFLDQSWRSGQPCREGLRVKIELDGQGRITAVSPEGEPMSWLTTPARRSGLRPPQRLLSFVSHSGLVAGVLLILCWIFVTSFYVQLPLMGKVGFTLWDALGFFAPRQALVAVGRNGHPTAGLFGLLAVVCLAGPLLARHFNIVGAVSFGTLPLLLLFLVILATTYTSHGSASIPGSANVFYAVSVAPGIYLSLLTSLYCLCASACACSTAAANPTRLAASSSTQ